MPLFSVACWRARVRVDARVPLQVIRLLAGSVRHSGPSGAREHARCSNPWHPSTLQNPAERPRPSALYGCYLAHQIPLLRAEQLEWRGYAIPTRYLSVLYDRCIFLMHPAVVVIQIWN